MLPRLTNFSKIIISWSVITAGSIFAFYLSKKSVDKRRYENMKIRERMAKANVGEYEPSQRKFVN